MRIDDLLAEFGAYQRRRNLSPYTMSHRRSMVKALDGYLRDRHGVGVLDATPKLIEKFLDNADVTPQTRYTYISYLAAFYTWAVRAGYVAADPTEHIERPKLPKRLPRPVVSQGLEDALRYADPRMRCWIMLGAYQGFRCIEIARLRGEDVDVARMTITARGKGGRERTIALHPKTLEALREYGLPARGLVFERRGGGPIQPSTISRYISRHLGDVGTAHQLRHWFATEVYDRSHDLLLTQQLLGHASPSTTAIYAQVNSERGRDVIGRLGGGRVA